MTGHMYLAFTKLGDILLFETYFNILSLIGFGLKNYDDKVSPSPRVFVIRPPILLIPSLTSGSTTKFSSTFKSFSSSLSFWLSLNQLLIAMPLFGYNEKFSGKLSTITTFERSLPNLFKSFKYVPRRNVHESRYSLLLICFARSTSFNMKLA